MRDSGRILWGAAVLGLLFVSFSHAEGKPDIEAVRQRASQKNYTFRVGPNPATEFTLEQLCGTRVPAGFAAKIAAAAAPAGDLALPQAFDWRKLDGCTPVKNQGGCGSCWAFAAMGITESQYLIRAGIEQDFSEQWLVSCTDAGSCDGGWYGAALDYMISVEDPYKKIGAPLEEMFPYEARDIPCNVPAEAVRYILTDWEAVQQDVDAMKQAIQTHGPIAVTIYANDLFQCYVGGVFNAHEDGDSNHAVVLVGWDDTQGESGIWFLRNSWGTGWGENGYMRIEYGRNNVGGSPSYATLTPDNEPNEWTVPSVVPTLRAAMDVAATGDLIILEPGIYTGPDNTDLRFGGKNVTIRSVNPADTAVVAATVIDCQGSSDQPRRAFIFDNGEGPGAVLNGLTIRNGYPRDNGGAIYCYYSNPTFKNCVIENNTASGYKKAGGAIALYNSSPRIINCRIRNNSASSYGGGISCRDSSEPWISNCEILDNTAGTEGGGLYGWVNARVTLENTVIAGNHAGEAGGGVYFYESTPEDVNDIIDDTSVGLLGATATRDPNAPSVSFCTIADNTSDGLGGGLFCMDSIVRLHNSILWNNQCSEPTGGQITMTDDSLSGTLLKVDYCNITGLDQGHYVDAQCTLEWGEGNIEVEPMFVNAAQRDYHLKSAAGHWDSSIDDWALDDGGNYDPADDENSPCIDAGDPATGTRNELRCNGDRANIGAYGGTEQASRSANQKCCMMCLPADFNCDCLINLEDMAIMLEDWLKCNFLPRYYCDEG